MLPLLTGYFVWKRRLGTGTIGWLAVAFVAAVMFANFYPLRSGRVDRAAHRAAPADRALAGRGGRLCRRPLASRSPGRMDFIRFSGELFIYYVLIALGGGVLTAFLVMMFEAIGMDAEPFIESWLLPCGAAGPCWSPPGWWRPSRA